jgi:SAM-dependent methyltransferase
MYINLNHDTCQFMKSYNKCKLIEPYILKKFNELSNENKIIFLTNLVNQTTSVPNINVSNKNFKMEYFSSLFEFIVDNINKLYLSTELSNEITCLDNLLLGTLLDKLTKLFKGQRLLNKLNHHINKLIKLESHIIHYLHIASQSGTFVTFIFWLYKTKNKNLESIKPYTLLEQIYIESIGNSDDRLYKYILTHIIKHNKLFFQKNNNVINNLISNLANSMIPPKFQLKRIKMLSQQISLIPYFEYMIITFNYEKVLFELHKHYYVEPHSYTTLYHLIIKITDNEKFNTILDLLKTKKEKISAQIILSIHTCKNYDFNIINSPILEKIVIDNYLLIIRHIDWSNFIDTLDFVDLNKKILSILVNNNLITQSLNINNSYIYNPTVLFFTRFLSVFNDSNKKLVITVNLFLHKLRLIAKKKSKSKIIQQNIKLFDLVNEIKNFTPNKAIPVLTRGSNVFQQQKQKFTNLPPRHLLPGELLIYKNFLLREKADGILINNLPVGIFPHTSIISNYQVKAEYIEELDLYLVFDVDIPNTSIIDRYNILRQSHQYTSSYHLEDVNNFDDILKIMDKERSQIKKFISENQQNPTKWYPKFACKYNYVFDKNIYKQLIEQVILEQDETIRTKLKAYELYNCDGLILSPLDGKREIKIKPKTQMTIDLMFTNNIWIDRNNNDWSYMIIKTNNPDKHIKEGRIYRCYPQLNSVLKFTVGEYRYDKKHPNPYNVIDSVINMLKYEWSNDLNDMQSYYYDENKSLKSSKLIQTIQTQNNLLEQRIEMFKPYVNKHWLDLGCGKGKLVHIIKKYNPKTYMGLDVDINQLVRALKFHDENQNIYNFNPCDLSTKWETTKNKWFSFNNNVKYDYVIANFSLMHFCTEDFWSQLNEIVHKETKLIFNLINSTDSTHSNEWNESNSFLKIQDNIVSYKFEWTHNDIKNEPLINKKLITSYLDKFGWKVIDTSIINSHNTLINLYSWWIVQKN